MQIEKVDLFKRNNLCNSRSKIVLGVPMNKSFFVGSITSFKNFSNSFSSPIGSIFKLLSIRNVYFDHQSHNGVRGVIFD